MLIKRVVIENYKSFEKFELAFNSSCNIIVGDNEAGKSTLLEAINLCLTGQLNGRSINYELSPFLFNKNVVDAYVQKLRAGENVELPKITIELYLDDLPMLASFRGTNNSKKENEIGLFICIEFNDEYSEEYENYIKAPEEIKTVPTEYFEANWYSFGFGKITSRGLPIKTSLIDTTLVRLQNGMDCHIQKTIDDILEKKEKANLSLLYRSLKEDFADEDAIKAINIRINKNGGVIAHKNFSVSVDISHKTNWDSNLTSYVDDIPFQYIGKGDQNVLKMILALDRKHAKESDVILIEEPENHLSFSSMTKLLKIIEEKCEEKQLIMTTHSAYVINKLGIEKLILLGANKRTVTFDTLPEDTRDYFRKLPGYDTLRLVLTKKAILVEGPSDELIVQRAYKDRHGKLPIEDGVDVISVGTSFKRFLDLAVILGKHTTVVTDNDGNFSRVQAKYQSYVDKPFIKVCCDPDVAYRTLEPQLLKYNGLASLNTIFKKAFTTEAELGHYMLENKTDCALALFETTQPFVMPEYIQNAVQ